MTSKLIERAVAVCIAVIVSAPAWAQGRPATVDGELWLNSAPDVRKAFIVGATSMIAAESAYSKKKGTPLPGAGTRVAEAMERLTLDQVSHRITRWYEANPDGRSMPVMGVIWVDMVESGAARK